MTTADRIDVHTHVIPPFWAESLDDHGGDPSGWTVPQWSPDAHLKLMDDNQIATSVLSLTAPSVVGWKGRERCEMARRVNEYVAELAASHPGRFGNFATVPLPDVENAIAEAGYALDHLNADGIVVLTNYAGAYLGDRQYAPLWEAMNARGAVVFIHPGHPQMANLDGVPGPLVDYPFDTTRNAVHMVFNSVLDNYPKVKFIISHAGGFVPYSVLRFCYARTLLEPTGPSADDLLAKFKLFYYDTALSSGPTAFPSLLSFVENDHILFGSDFPYAPAKMATLFTELLDTQSGLTDGQLAAINKGNATKLLGRA